MYFNSEAYKKAFPKAESKPAPAEPEKTAEAYDENATESIEQVAEETTPAEDATEGDDLPGEDEGSEEGEADGRDG